MTTLEGGDGNDTLTDTSGNNSLKGGAGDDTINGSGTFEGGTGNDSLSDLDIGNADTYIFNAGDGQDTITEWSYSPADGYSSIYSDTISFGAGITAAQIQFLRSGNDLIFKVSETDQDHRQGVVVSTSGAASSASRLPMARCGTKRRCVR